MEKLTIDRLLAQGIRRRCRRTTGYATLVGPDECEPHLGRHLQRHETGDGSVCVHLRPDEYGWLVRVLLGLGTDATVVSPPELRAQAQQAAQAIARHYA